MRFCSTGELAGKGMAGACRVAAAEDPATPEASTAIPEPAQSTPLLSPEQCHFAAKRKATEPTTVKR